MSYYDEGYAGNPICGLPWLVHLGIGIGSIGVLIFGGKHRWWGLAGLGFNVVSGLTCPPTADDMAEANKILGQLGIGKHGYGDDY